MTIATACILVLLFYWVPFAAGAWFTDVYKPEHDARARRDVSRPDRHIAPSRPAGAHV